MRVNTNDSELNLANIYYSHGGCILYLLEHDKLILCIIPLVDLMLIPETDTRLLMQMLSVADIMSKTQT